MDHLTENDPQAAEKAQMAMDLIMPVLQHPMAIYFGGVLAGANGAPPLPKIAVLCDAGPDAPALSQSRK